MFSVPLITIRTSLLWHVSARFKKLPISVNFSVSVVLLLPFRIAANTRSCRALAESSIVANTSLQ